MDIYIAVLLFAKLVKNYISSQFVRRTKKRKREHNFTFVSCLDEQKSFINLPLVPTHTFSVFTNLPYIIHRPGLNGAWHVGKIAIHQTYISRSLFLYSTTY